LGGAPVAGKISNSDAERGNACLTVAFSGMSYIEESIGFGAWSYLGVIKKVRILEESVNDRSPNFTDEILLSEYSGLLEEVDRCLSEMQHEDVCDKSCRREVQGEKKGNCT